MERLNFCIVQLLLFHFTNTAFKFKSTSGFATCFWLALMYQMTVFCLTYLHRETTKMNINLTWQRINCKQEAIPLLISVGVREAEALIAESLSKWDTRLYVNCAMFGCGSSAPLASWATSLRKRFSITCSWIYFILLLDHQLLVLSVSKNKLFFSQDLRTQAL